YALSLISDLLTVAALEAGKLPIDKSPESVRAIVEEAVALQRPLADERALKLEISLAGEPHPVSVDRNRILQVLTNLLGNAVKFTPEGGCVRVECRCDESSLHVAVSDTGPGIGEEEQAHVFDRFWQGVHAQRAGAGLGLAIAKGIVEAHGGTIAVESVEGQGATFRFSLPVAP
ncbi:MAG TPA: HAMP domain-containing sensor histidine kinase, partial [Polyangiaceae bacterium]|nr:HAMP domain-containing sensor histidine kinase [Polyangiaceae bacterium]